MSLRLSEHSALRGGIHHLIPPRSRLYSLVPIGVGTPHVESLSGYAARLTVSHSTTLYHIFSKEVAPLINKPGTIGLRVSFASFAKAASGLGVIAADLVRVFEMLTVRQDLRFTTMLPWSGSISSKSLTREWRAWCPDCYEDCALEKGQLYDQLLWSIQSVTICPRHKRRLAHECPHCGRRQVTLAHCVRPGFCMRCQRWLGCRPRWGAQAAPPWEATEEELRIAEEVGELLAAAPALQSLSNKLSFSESLKAYVGNMFMGRGVPSRVSLPADKQTIRCWLQGTQTPSLALLAKTCLALGVSPVNLLWEINGRNLDGEVERIALGHGTAGCLPATGQMLAVNTAIDWRDAKSVARAEKRLREALEEHPPPSLTGIAKELGCAKGTLRKKFPAAASYIAERAAAYYRPSISSEKMLEALLAALKESSPPTLEEVSRRLGAGASNVTLHKRFPEESRRIVERYSSYNRRRLDINALERHLRAALERNPPPSMRDISKEIGVATATLYSKLPILVNAISARFAADCRERNTRNREKARAEIKAICEKLLREGLYPYAAMIRSQLSLPCQSDAFLKMRREILTELGFFMSEGSLS